MHVDDPINDEKLPAGHSEQDDPMSAYDPIGQFVHFDEKGPEKAPNGQVMHVVVPVVEYVPAGQGEQLPAPVVEYVPAAQFVQDDKPDEP